MTWRERTRTVVTTLLLTTLLRAATLLIPFFNADEAYLATQGHVLAQATRDQALAT